MAPIDSAAKHHLPPRLMPSVGDTRLRVTPRPTFARGAGTFFKLDDAVSQIVHLPRGWTDAKTAQL
jgi:hypothetical protein